MIRRTCLLAVVAVVGCAIGLRPGAAQTPPAALLSPEEAVVALLPYRLQQADAPAGFQVVTEGSLTPAELSYRIGSTQDESQQVLKQLRLAGYQVQLAQALLPNSSTPVRIFVYSITSFTDATKASAFLHDSLDQTSTQTTTYDNPPVPVRLGDESGAVHSVTVRANSNNAQRELLVWRRGRLLFEVELETLDSTESLDQVVPIAVAADRRVAAAGQPTTAALTTRPAGSEEYRVDALYGLFARLPDDTQAPLGLLARGTATLNNADLVLAAADSGAMLTRIAQSWRRIIGVQTTYDTLQREDGEVLTVNYGLSADVGGAQANLLDPERRPDGTAFAAYALPQPLGDDGRLYYETYTTDNGVPHESWRAIWIRGLVVLSVTGTAPAGGITAQDVMSFAALVDARYNRGALPTILTAPLAPAALPIPSPTPLPVTGG